MARPLRIEYDGAVYHVTSRGNGRKSIFREDEDRILFLETLLQVAKRYNWLCHAYCLMNNHYHLVVETPDGNLSRGMRQLNGVYTQTCNRRYHRPGHVFQGRYKAILVEKESHLLEVCRYVVLNPVRARAVKEPREWRWSSYEATAGDGPPHLCLTTDWVLGQFGRRRKDAQKQYREFVAAGIGERGIWSDVRGQSVLGKEDFAESMAEYAKGFRDAREIPRQQRYIGRPELKDLFVREAGKGKGGRDRMIREAVQEHGYSQREIAECLGLHYTSISRIVNNS